MYGPYIAARKRGKWHFQMYFCSLEMFFLWVGNDLFNRTKATFIIFTIIHHFSYLFASILFIFKTLYKIFMARFLTIIHKFFGQPFFNRAGIIE